MPVPTSDGNPALASDPTSPGTKSLTTPKPSPATQTTPLTKTATVSKGTQPKTTSSPKSSPSKAPAPAPTPSMPPAEGKKVRRKASKPIINWFQRKLAGRKPITPHAPGIERGRDPGPKYPRPRSVGPASSRKRRSGATAGDADGEHETSIRDGTSVRSRSLSPSLGPGSMWSPSMQPEADDDASIRPLPPTSPPSPSPSNTTHLTQTTHSGYGSDPRTVASHTASTKPTTLLSVDIGIVGTPAHIAQANPSIPTVVAPSPSSSPQFARFPSTRSMHQPVPSTASVTFSTVPYPSSPLSTSPYFLAEDDVQDLDASTQAPSHSLPHPRNNPRPSSPPLDNASMLTLASSTFNNPCQVEQDAVSASVRAIRRRGSWESGESRWSAVMGLRRPGSTRTAGSWRTGASIGGGIMLDPNQIEPFDGESGSESDTEDKENGADIKAEEVPLPESPVKGHISPVTPLSIQTELPVGLETGGGRTSDEAPSTAIPGRASLDYGEETEKESDGGHGEEPKAKESEKTKVKKIGDAISAALDSLPE